LRGEGFDLEGLSLRERRLDLRESLGGTTLVGDLIVLNEGGMGLSIKFL